MGKWGAWTWSDAAIFIGVFAFIRVAMIWLATKMFLALIPHGVECPLCDGHTLPIERVGWWRVLGARFRRSWCIDCGWEGILQRDPSAYAEPITNSLSHSGQLPLISKKSSK